MINKAVKTKKSESTVVEEEQGQQKIGEELDSKGKDSMH